MRGSCDRCNHMTGPIQRACHRIPLSASDRFSSLPHFPQRLLARTAQPRHLRVRVSRRLSPMLAIQQMRCLTCQRIMMHTRPPFTRKRPILLGCGVIVDNLWISGSGECAGTDDRAAMAAEDALFRFRVCDRSRRGALGKTPRTVRTRGSTCGMVHVGS